MCTKSLTQDFTKSEKIEIKNHLEKESYITKIMETHKKAFNEVVNIK